MIGSVEPLIVADMATDPIWEVPGIEEMGARAYVGVPLLRSDGTVSGTLCGLDSNAQEPTPEAVACLQLLASLAAFQLERDERAAERERLEEMRGILLTARVIQHRLNNALSLVRGYAELLSNEPSLPPSLAPLVAEVQTGAIQAAAEIERLLANPDPDALRTETAAVYP